MKSADEKNLAKEKILEQVRLYYQNFVDEKKTFEPGDKIPYAGRVFDENEMVNLVDSALEFWLTSGRYTVEFEKRLGEYLGIRYCSAVNSGSSANLLAFMALTSPLLGDRQIKRGDEVITVAAGFPTTVSPVVQYGAVPVFADVTIPQYNIDVKKLEAALSGKTKAVMIAHTLGNPFNLKAVREFCDRHGLWLVEDNCDALGSVYTLNGARRLTGTVGDIGTSSFYPPHHMTMGEGGAVYTDHPLLHKIVRSLRDWGRECTCSSGVDNSCGHRFDKYVYSHFGYNLKPTDLQAAIGCAQLDKLPDFVNCRKENFRNLRAGLEDLSDKFFLPEACENSEPSWFGFILTCKQEGERAAIINTLEERGIQTRMLFAGNLIKHPCFQEMRNRSEGFRVAGELKNTDYIMNNSFWIGVYPGMTDEKIKYMTDVLHQCV